MPTQQQISDIIDYTQKRLGALANEARLQVTGSRLEDDWLYIVVTPDGVGVRASDHASIMSKIEQELHERGYDNVLLVPALED